MVLSIERFLHPSCDWWGVNLPPFSWQSSALTTWPHSSLSLTHTHTHTHTHTLTLTLTLTHSSVPPPTYSDVIGHKHAHSLSDMSNSDPSHCADTAVHSSNMSGGGRGGVATQESQVHLLADTDSSHGTMQKPVSLGRGRGVGNERRAQVCACLVGVIRKEISLLPLPPPPSPPSPSPLPLPLS